MKDTIKRMNRQATDLEKIFANDIPDNIQLSKKCEVKVAQSCPSLCEPMDYTVRGILQARILERVAFLFSRGSSQETKGSNPGLPCCRQILYKESLNNLN